MDPVFIDTETQHTKHPASLQPTADRNLPSPWDGLNGCPVFAAPVSPDSGYSSAHAEATYEEDWEVFDPYVFLLDLSLSFQLFYGIHFLCILAIEGRESTLNTS